MINSRRRVRQNQGFIWWMIREINYSICRDLKRKWDNQLRHRIRDTWDINLDRRRWWLSSSTSPPSSDEELAPSLISSITSLMACFITSTFDIVNDDSINDRLWKSQRGIFRYSSNFLYSRNMSILPLYCHEDISTITRANVTFTTVTLLHHAPEVPKIHRSSRIAKYYYKPKH